MYIPQLGDTPLILAARFGHTDIVRDLMSAGVTVDSLNRVSTIHILFLTCIIIIGIRIHIILLTGCNVIYNARSYLAFVPSIAVTV